MLDASFVLNDERRARSRSRSSSLDIDDGDIGEAMDDYEAERLRNIRERDALLFSLGLDSKTSSRGSALLPKIDNGIKKLAMSSAEARRRREAKAKEAALRAQRSVEPTRRSGRLAARAELEGEDHTTASPARTLSPPPPRTILPKSRAPTLAPGPSYSPTWSSSTPLSPAPRPTRGADGRLVFEGRYNGVFAPNLTPEEMFAGGAFGGGFFANTYSNVLRTPLPADEDVSGLPFSVRSELLSNSDPDGDLNRFRVRAGQSLQEWEKAGWIWSGDPRGWAQWYLRFWDGRRCEDDERQVRRWLKVAGPTGRFKRALLKKIHGSGGVSAVADEDVGRVLRQCLWQWGYEMNEGEYERAIAGE